MRKLLLSLILVLVIFSISVNAQTVVNTTADNTIVEDEVTTLREAVEFANITAGVQTITFDPSVFPIGSGTVIFLDTSLFVTDEAGAVISGEGAEVILDTGKVAFYSGIVLQAGNNTIRNMNIRNFGVAGIEVDSSLTGNYGNNIFTGNEIWFSGTGILANTSNGNEFLFNNIHDNSNSGIEVDYSSNNLFRGNLLADNGFDGLTIFKGSGSNTIEENIVLGNSNDGMSLYGGMNNNNVIFRNNIGDSSFIPAIPVSALKASKSVDRLSEIIDRVDRKILLNLRDMQQKSRIRSIESSLLKTERKSILRRPGSNLRTSENTLNKPDAALVPELKERVAAVPPTLLSESGGSVTAFHTGNSNAGIYLYGVNNTTIEDNLIFGSGYVGLYIDGFFKIDTTFVDGVPTFFDTTYYFPYGIYVNDNRFVRNDYVDIEFCYIESMDVTNNSFVQSSMAIYGYGSFGQYDSSPMITGGIVNVIDNEVTSSTGGSSGYFFGAYYLYKANMHNNIISSVYAATDLRDIGIIHISENRMENVAYAVYVDFYDSLFVEHNYVINGYAPFEMYTDSGYMEITYNELIKSEYGMDFSGCFLCNGTAIFSHNKIQGTYAYGITGYDMGYV